MCSDSNRIDYFLEIERPNTNSPMVVWKGVVFFFSFFLSFWLCWVFIAALALLQLLRAEILFVVGFGLLIVVASFLMWCRAWALGHVDFSRWGTWAQQLGSQALEHRPNSCSTWAQLLRSMWDLPRSGIEPVSSALAGGFFTTEPAGKPWD